MSRFTCNASFEIVGIAFQAGTVRTLTTHISSIFNPTVIAFIHTNTAFESHSGNTFYATVSVIAGLAFIQAWKANFVTITNSIRVEEVITAFNTNISFQNVSLFANKAFI
jgi:hypothetical protein